MRERVGGARTRLGPASLRDPKEVLAEGTRAMWDLAGSGFGRASYLRVSDGVVTQEAIADDRGSVPTSYLLKDDPYVQTVLDSGRPLLTRVDRTSLGPTRRALTDGVDDVVEAVLIPVTVHGELHGMFQVDSRGTGVSEDAFGRCRSMADVVELALSDAIAHQELEQLANTDPLTGAANRRGLSLHLQGARRHDIVSILVIVIDVDRLESINDAQGYDAGNRVLVAVAQAVAAVLREGDLLARTGGDEFLAVVADADAEAARRVADRVTDAVTRVAVDGVGASVTVGFASGGPDDVDRLVRQADEAQHEARRHRARHSRVIDRA
jgi:diguanylate cyclase (GGDEF)-like protein